jgi:hypothetical protein
MTDAAELARESRREILEELRKIADPQSADRIVSAIENLVEAIVLMRITRAMPPLR